MVVDLWGLLGVGAEVGGAAIKMQAARNLRKQQEKRDKKLRQIALDEIARGKEQYEEDWERNYQLRRQKLAERGLGRSSIYEDEMGYLQRSRERGVARFSAMRGKINTEYRYARAQRTAERKFAYAGGLSVLGQTFTSFSGQGGESTPSGDTTGGTGNTGYSYSNIMSQYDNVGASV